MRIALITDEIDDGGAGLATYARGLVEGLEELGGATDVTLVHGQAHPFYEGRTNLRIRSLQPRRPASKGLVNKIVRKQALLPLVLSKKFDLVHDAYHYAPFLAPSPFRKVVTIQDLIPLVMPETTSRSAYLVHKTLVRSLVRRADRVIVPSECTRRDVVRLYGKAPGQVVVTPYGANDALRPVESQRALEEVRLRLGLPERFFLYVGTIEPRKNLVRLIKAFKLASGELGDVALVIAGGLGWKFGPILEAARDPDLAGRLIMPGRVAAEDLAALYSMALAFVFPSLYEGFGLPPLEAMQCRAPVIAADASSLPEVVGDAALLVDPTSVHSIATALQQVANSESLREKLKDAGQARAAQFSWRRCAAESSTVYEAAAA